jgi:hypothetical protein
MAAIEPLLAFMRVNFDPTVLKPRRAFPKIGPVDYGWLLGAGCGFLSSIRRRRIHEGSSRGQLLRAARSVAFGVGQEGSDRPV